LEGLNSHALKISCTIKCSTKEKGDYGLEEGDMVRMRQLEVNPSGLKPHSLSLYQMLPPLHCVSFPKGGVVRTPRATSPLDPPSEEKVDKSVLDATLASRGSLSQLGNLFISERIQS
jgi:hypothetical protein